MNFLEDILRLGDEVVGDRTLGEQKYDREVVRWMRKGKSVERAVEKANHKYPDEALIIDVDTLHTLQAHYEYLADHEAIMEKLNKLK